MHCVDVADLLPVDWQAAAIAFAASAAKPFRRDGPTMSAPDSPGLAYAVADGHAVGAGALWLHTFHRSDRLLGRVRDLVGHPVIPSPRLRFAVNVNVLQGVGAMYEMHRDTMPGVTAILFATTLDPSDGGAFIHGDRRPERCSRVVPVAGQMVVGDFHAIWHGVEPLTRNVLRVSVPLEFTLPGSNANFDDSAAYLPDR